MFAHVQTWKIVHLDRWAHVRVEIHLGCLRLLMIPVFPLLFAHEENRPDARRADGSIHAAEMTEQLKNMSMYVQIYLVLKAPCDRMVGRWILPPEDFGTCKSCPF